MATTAPPASLTVSNNASEKERARPTTCRMFETPLIEKFSRIHPSQPFLFWLPVIAYFIYRTAQEGVQPLPAVGLVLGGLLVWSLTEYVLHRYAFHYQGPRAWQRRLYFVLHGVHHDFPQDADRLVMPLGASIPIGFSFFLLFRVLLGSALGSPLFVGFAIGYLAYDGTHYAVHHFRMSSRWGKWIKRYHMVHHHTGENARWGVSSPLWDWVFGTMGDNKEAR